LHIAENERNGQSGPGSIHLAEKREWLLFNFVEQIPRGAPLRGSGKAAAGHENPLQTGGQSTPDSTASLQEFEAANATHSE
jgi:hypothetical protein